ncbi:MAG: hypothetical protein A4E69_02277 [Syntrophus sp. PtaB.Bin138]|nr:MAG: hypothetical protein A4E69_02277 [Syntrophus sp. PtaB.Bin138]
MKRLAVTGSPGEKRPLAALRQESRGWSGIRGGRS